MADGKVNQEVRAIPTVMSSEDWIGSGRGEQLIGVGCLAWSMLKTRVMGVNIKVDVIIGLIKWSNNRSK